jgi:sec-independent protein translocase protein TatA
MNLGPGEIALIVLGVIVLFGAKKLPEIARSVGKAKGEFKKGLEEGDGENRKTPE